MVFQYRFEAFGAQKIVPRHNVDMEDWSIIDQWMDCVLEYLYQHVIDLPVTMDYIVPVVKDGGYDRNTPFMATLKVNCLLVIYLFRLYMYFLF